MNFADPEFANPVRDNLKTVTESIASGMKRYKGSIERAINKIIENRA